MSDQGFQNIKISQQILENSLKSNKLSHAYLFELKDNSDEIVFSFIKKIICSNIQNKNCKECSICNRIDNENYPGLRIIKPDGQFIKKEQLLELQKDFSKKSLESDKLIYVIYNADKMNSAAANTILKFLEEPSDGIIAILLTNNIHSVIDTIYSRCQIINCKYTLYNAKDIFSDDQLQYVLTFIDDLETNKINFIAKVGVLWNNILIDRETFQNYFELIFLIYFNTLQYMLNTNIVVFKTEEYIKNLAQKNTIYSIKQKLLLIENVIENLKYNVNLNMLMDKFIIELDGVDKNEYCSN